MPITRRPGGAYQVTVCFGGRTTRRSSRHWTLADARAVERQMLAQVTAAAAGREPDKLIADALEKWLLEDVPELRSARKTRNHVKGLLPYVAGRKLTDCAAVWSEIRLAERGKAPATINHKGRILRQVTRKAWREWGWLDRPAAITLLPETPREVFLSREQVDALAAACEQPATAGYILLAAYTGLRRGHLLRLTRHDVDGDFLVIDRTGKTRKLQRVPIHPRIAPLVGSLPFGIGDRQLNEDWMLARVRCGLRHVRWHDLRHTCASWLVQAGVPLELVAELLGHSSLAMTRRYAHFATADLTAAVRKLA